MSNSNKKIKAVIVDDEADSIFILHKLIQENCPLVEIVSTAQTVESGVQVIRNCNPDLVFLDICIGNNTGFELLEQTSEEAFKVIFVSGHDSHAVKAFRYSAVDYLLKPVDQDELMASVAKLNNPEEPLEIARKKLGNVVRNFRQEDKRIVLQSLNSIEFIDLNRIVRCESSNIYTSFHLTNKEVLVISRSISEYEEMLGNTGFFRAHQSHLINLNHIKKYIKTDGGEIIMSDGSSVPLSRRKKQEFMEVIASN